jgi:hypothetical protein
MMKKLCSLETSRPKVLIQVDGWVDVKVVLWIAFSNKKLSGAEELWITGQQYQDIFLS